MVVSVFFLFCIICYEMKAPKLYFNIKPADNDACFFLFVGGDLRSYECNVLVK